MVPWNGEFDGTFHLFGEKSCHLEKKVVNFGEKSSTDIDKTAKEGEDPFKVSGREILANMDKNTKQALQKAKTGLSKTILVPGGVSYIAVASLALVLVSRDGCTYGGQFDNPWDGGINDPRKLCSC